MSVEQTFHMVGGDGPTSYASNSFKQATAIHQTKPLLEKIIENIHSSILHGSLAVADLGCASGPNTLMVTSNIIAAMSKLSTRERCNPPEIHFYLNDLPGNDFNYVFASLDTFRNKIKEEIPEEDVRPIYYVYGAPGSYFGRLFPKKSIHFFHSSNSLHWLSQVPPGLKSDRGEWLNNNDIYITKKSPPEVQMLYLEQFSSDFSTFLKSRSEEIVGGGQMMLSFMGRTSSDPTICKGSSAWGLLADSIHSLVKEGLVEEDKLKAFNLPFYSPSIEEVRSVISKEGSFELVHVQAVENTANPPDPDSDEIIVHAQNTVNTMKAILLPMLIEQFGDAIMDDLIAIYLKNVAKHHFRTKAKPTTLVTILKAK